MKKITEQKSPHRHLEKMPVGELLQVINSEDQLVAVRVGESLPQIKAVVQVIVNKMRAGGRLFYIGAGTSGRLGILDASECPPTFGIPHDWVIGLIAGGDAAIRKAVEFAEDDKEQAWKDLRAYGVNVDDVVIGIASSGTTPYVVHGLSACRQHGISTACITCNPDSPLEAESDLAIVCITGPEVVTGSTRMKAGTAQKLILNMISTAVMIQLGRVEDNVMVDMQLSNDKLIDRGTRILMKELGLDYEKAKARLLTFGSVREALRHGPSC